MANTDLDIDDILDDEDEGLPKKKKKKKGWVGLIVFLSILAILIGVPVAAVYIFVADNNHEELVIDSELTPAKLGEKIIVDAFDTTKDDGLIKVEVTRNDLNSIIDNSIGQIKEASKGIVQQLYLNIDGNDYHIYLEAQVKEVSFHTRLDLHMHLEESETEFKFVIDDVSVGKLHELQSVINTVIDEVAPDLDVNSVFDDLGLSMEADLHAGTLTYKKADLIKDIKKMLPEGNELITNTFNTFFDEKYINYNIEKDTFITAEINLNKFESNSLYSTNDDEHLIFNEPSYKAENPGKDELSEFVRPKLDSLINAGIASEITQIEPLFRLFFTGYDQLSADHKNIINALYSGNESNFAELGVTNLTTYAGARGPISEEELLTKTLNEIKSRPLTELAAGHIGHLYESDINEYMSNSPLLGFTTILAREDGDSIKYNFIAIDNFYCNLTNNRADFVCGLNINGFETNLVFDMPVIQEESSGVHITFGMNDIFYGEEEIDGLQTVLFRIIGEAFKGDNSFIINKEEQTITFNLNEILDQTNEILGENSIPAVSEDKFTISAVGNSMEEDGYIDIGFTF